MNSRNVPSSRSRITLAGLAKISFKSSALLSLGKDRHHSRVHDHNPLEQTFICLGASAYRPLAEGQPIPGAPADCTGDAMLAAFGLG